MSIYKVTFGITNVIYVMADDFAEVERKTLKIIKRDFSKSMQIYAIEYLGEAEK